MNTFARPCKFAAMVVGNPAVLCPFLTTDATAAETFMTCSKCVSIKTMLRLTQAQGAAAYPFLEGTLVEVGTVVIADQDISVIEKDLTTRMAVPKGTSGVVTEVITGVVYTVNFDVNGTVETILIPEMNRNAK